MILDKQNMFSEAQAVTASAASSNVIDLGVARDIYPGGGLELMVRVIEAFDAAGAATLQVAVQGSTDNATFYDMATTMAIGKANLTAGAVPVRMSMPGPAAGQAFPRYIRLYYTVATGPMTAGSITAALVLDNQLQHDYPAGQTTLN